MPNTAWILRFDLRTILIYLILLYCYSLSAILQSNKPNLYLHTVILVYNF